MGLAALAVPLVYVLLLGLVASVLFAYELYAAPERWISPGDPALAEPGFYGALVVLAGICALAILCFCASRFLAVPWLRRRTFRRLAYVASAALVLATTPSLACIASRHGPAWSALREESWKLVAKAGRVEAWPTEVRRVEVRGWGETVELSVLEGGRRPRIRVDFGDGCVAHFDLRTMFCLYSD